ncbi:predicted protein [Aspergillus lentulus]|uniref:Clr5 domain-containing protein n=1 Tax=Aspergillus lentulus TaxID=293939 RepID=A0ABQ1AJQ8_ASPLE|nr:predicted protein [Aspergillus lentulus]GFF86485.1 predicted protein [Aspergillus lentulus]
MERARVYAEHRLQIFRIYVTEDRTREQAKLEFEDTGLVPESRLTIDQWKALLRDLRIFKNIRGEEAVFMNRILDQTPDYWYCLAFAGDVLLCNDKVARHCARRKKAGQEHLDEPDRRYLTWFYLPFSLASALSDPAAFKNFQHLLFATRVHFESSFERGIWAPNNQGLYARSPDLRVQLTELSQLHNLVVDALKQFSMGETGRGGAQIRAASLLYERVVRSRHHRQLPDLLAILLLIWRSGHKQLQQSITAKLSREARRVLIPNDPRRIMFECLTMLDPEHICHLYLAFDGYCRYLWMAYMSKINHDMMKAYYSYNQASFPRADVGGFYSLYSGMSLDGIEKYLVKADLELGSYSTETFALWHTALRYLWSEERYLEMAFLSQRLCDRVGQLEASLDYTEHKQLNLDGALTFYLLGQAQEALGYPLTARGSFDKSVQLRNLVLPDDRWDAAKGAALSKLIKLDTNIGRVHGADCSAESIKRMYTNVEIRVENKLV